MNEGYIKLFRCMTEWEWYKDVTTTKLFIHLLIKANWQDSRFMGYDIPRGSFATSVKHLSDESGLTVKQVRRSLEKLEQTGEIIKKRASKFSLITVVKFGDFQGLDSDQGKQRANRGQSKGNQRATIEEYKNIRKKEYKPSQASIVSERTYSEEQLNGLYKRIEDIK